MTVCVDRPADDLDRQIRELTALSDTLRHVADCPAPSHMECGTFRRLVEVAGKRAGGARQTARPAKDRLTGAHRLTRVLQRTISKQLCRRAYRQSLNLSVVQADSVRLPSCAV